MEDTEEVSKAHTEDTTHCSLFYVHGIGKVAGGKMNAVTAVRGG